MKKLKPIWPGFMDEIEAVKKASAIADASFTAFFFSGKRKAKTSLCGAACLPAYGDETA